MSTTGALSYQEQADMMSDLLGWRRRAEQAEAEIEKLEADNLVLSTARADAAGRIEQLERLQQEARAATFNAAWEAILAADGLAQARQKLSIHELRQIISATLNARNSANCAGAAKSLTAPAKGAE